jgi:SWI/SNF-related matrix-associated actin-dependent regulator of chromatin subfamily A member 5
LPKSFWFNMLDVRAVADESLQEVDETPDYTDSDTNPNTTASSLAGDPVPDGRKRRSEVNQLRRSIFGRKHDRLGESKVRPGPT